MKNDTYILRARVIEGSIPMPQGEEYKHFDINDFQIVAPYTKENFQKLFAIGKEAWKGDLSKFEILAWSGNPDQHSGDRYLWSYRPDMWNFERISTSILAKFDTYQPIPMPEHYKQIYTRFWQKMPNIISLDDYEAATRSMASLADQIKSAKPEKKSKPNHPDKTKEPTI